MILIGHDAIVAEWVALKLGLVFAAPFVAIGRLDPAGERLIAGAVYTGYTGRNIDLTIYAPHGAAKRYWWSAVIYGYPFNDLNVARVSFKTRRANKSARANLDRFALFEGVQRRFFGPHRSDDAMLYAVFRKQAERFRYDEQQRAEAARSGEDGGGADGLQ